MKFKKFRKIIEKDIRDIGLKPKAILIADDEYKELKKDLKRKGRTMQYEGPGDTKPYLMGVRIIVTARFYNDSEDAYNEVERA